MRPGTPAASPPIGEQEDRQEKTRRGGRLGHDHDRIDPDESTRIEPLHEATVVDDGYLIRGKAGIAIERRVHQVRPAVHVPKIQEVTEFMREQFGPH